MLKRNSKIYMICLLLALFVLMGSAKNSDADYCLVYSGSCIGYDGNKYQKYDTGGVCPWDLPDEVNKVIIKVEPHKFENEIDNCLATYNGIVQNNEKFSYTSRDTEDYKYTCQSMVDYYCKNNGRKCQEYKNKYDRINLESEINDCLVSDHTCKDKIEKYCSLPISNNCLEYQVKNCVHEFDPGSSPSCGLKISEYCLSGHLCKKYENEYKELEKVYHQYFDLVMCSSNRGNRCEGAYQDYLSDLKNLFSDKKISEEVYKEQIHNAALYYNQTIQDLYKAENIPAKDGKNIMGRGAYGYDSNCAWYIYEIYLEQGINLTEKQGVDGGHWPMAHDWIKHFSENQINPTGEPIKGAFIYIDNKDNNGDKYWRYPDGHVMYIEDVIYDDSGKIKQVILSEEDFPPEKNQDDYYAGKPGDYGRFGPGEQVKVGDNDNVKRYRYTINDWDGFTNFISGGDRGREVDWKVIDPRLDK